MPCVPCSVRPAKQKQSSSVDDLSGTPDTKSSFGEFDDDSDLLMDMDIDSIASMTKKKKQKRASITKKNRQKRGSTFDEFDDDVDLLDVDPDLYALNSGSSSSRSRSCSSAKTSRARPYTNRTSASKASNKLPLDQAKTQLVNIQNTIKKMFDNFLPVPAHLAETREKLLRKWQELSHRRDNGPSTPALVQKDEYDDDDDDDDYDATNSPGTCKHCGKPGHYKFECPQLDGVQFPSHDNNAGNNGGIGSGSFGDTSRDNDRCYKCNQVGHWSSNCPNAAAEGENTPYNANVTSSWQSSNSNPGNCGGGSGSFGDTNRDNDRCYKCNQVGHWASNCPNPAAEGENTYNAKDTSSWRSSEADYGEFSGRDGCVEKTGTCHRCGQSGHWAADCPNSDLPRSSAPVFEYKATETVTRVSSSTAAATTFWADANPVNPRDCPFTTEEIYRELRETFGHRSFRECQLEVVQVCVCVCVCVCFTK